MPADVDCRACAHCTILVPNKSVVCNKDQTVLNWDIVSAPLPCPWFRPLCGSPDAKPIPLTKSVPEPSQAAPTEKRLDYDPKNPCCQEIIKYGVHSHAINQDQAGALKDTNPKDGIGETKLPLYLVPATAIAVYSLAHLNGGLKYGFWNWRKAGIRMSVYLNALRRHLSALENGEEVDPDDGVPHLAAMGACLNIIIDAKACGKLVDDRPPRVDIRSWFNKLTPIVTSLKKLHSKRNPRHWTIADSEICPCGLRLDEPGHGQVNCIRDAFADPDPNATRAR